jgi:hypothetical protein
MSTEISADELAFQEDILNLHPAIMEVMRYTLHGDLVCPTGEDLNPDGTTMVPACICAKHGTAAGMRRFFEYLVKANRDIRIMREIEAEKRRQNTSTCNQLLPPVCVGAIAMFVFYVLTM